MSLEAVLSGLAQGAGTAVAGYFQGESAKEAARLQKQTADEARQLHLDQYNQQRADLAPWQQAGTSALAELQNTRYQPFGMDQFQQDPGYQFRLGEGMKALERSAAARGGLISGGNLKAFQRYGQQMGSQEYQNAFNRYNTEFANRLNPLQSLAGFGQSAVGQMGAAGQNYAGNAGNLMMQGGNALAGGITDAANARTSGYVGGMNALNNALIGGRNYDQNQEYVNLLRGGRPQQQPAPTGGGVWGRPVDYGPDSPSLFDLENMGVSSYGD